MNVILAINKKQMEKSFFNFLTEDKEIKEFQNLIINHIHHFSSIDINFKGFEPGRIYNFNYQQINNVNKTNFPLSLEYLSRNNNG